MNKINIPQDQKENLNLTEKFEGAQTKESKGFYAIVRKPVTFNEWIEAFQTHVIVQNYANYLYFYPGMAERIPLEYLPSIYNNILASEKHSYLPYNSHKHVYENYVMRFYPVLYGFYAYTSIDLRTILLAAFLYLKVAVTTPLLQNLIGYQLLAFIHIAVKYQELTPIDLSKLIEASYADVNLDEYTVNKASNDILEIEGEVLNALAFKIPHLHLFDYLDYARLVIGQSDTFFENFSLVFVERYLKYPYLFFCREKGQLLTVIEIINTILA